ncbi:hypothetical protein BH11PSE2_BH11PSE2_19880 [soil metagenome]
MADGSLKLVLDDVLVEKIERAATAAGVTPEAYAIAVLDHAVSDGWAETDAAFAEYDRTGESIPAEEALAEFLKNVANRTSRSL